MADTTPQDPAPQTAADQFHQDLADDWNAEAYGDTSTTSPDQEQ
ncbi:hypothetical protein ACFV2X_49960 [Streptomyces sp. NPDC059679]